MRRLFIGLLAISTMGMGGKKPQIPDPSLPSPEPYQARFKSLGAGYSAAFIHQSATFSFRSFFGSTVGMCTYSSARAAVELSSSAWAKGSETFREMLVFHELGHCLLGRGHKNTRHSSGRPESLMNASLFNEQTYQVNRDAYLKELYTAENNRTQVVSAESGDFDGCSFGR